MKAKFRSLVACAVASAAFHVSGTAGAVPFSITVPDRTANLPSVPVAKLKFTFETASLTGATLTLGTSAAAQSSVDLSALGFNPLGSSADQVRVDKDAANKVITVTLDLKSHYGSDADATNRCLERGAATITYFGDFSPAVTGYRLTSYAAPSEYQCTCAVRRLKNNAAAWVTAPAAATADLGRHPIDIALVLDKSGSMGSPTPGDPSNLSKWITLQAAVNQFFGIWKVEGTSATQAGGTSLRDDRMGLVFFDSSIDPVLFGGQFWVARGNLPPADPNHPWKQLENAVLSRGPGSATALGGGLSKAIKNWQTSAINDPTIVLMTDGMQNQTPKVEQDASGFKILDLDESPAPDQGPKRLIDQCIPILGIAVGPVTGSTVGTPGELLENISQQTAGKARTTISSKTDFAFGQALVDALKGNTISALRQDEGTLPEGASWGDSVMAPLDGNVKQAIAVLSWLGHERSPLEFYIQDPNGNVVQPSVVLRDKGFTIVRVEGGTTGDWSFRVGRQGAGDPGGGGGGEGSGGNNNMAAPPRSRAAAGGKAARDEGGPAVPYHVSMYTVERGLDYHLTLGEERHYTGGAISLSADVVLDGKVLPNIGKDLHVELLAPGTALGTVLRASKGPDNGSGGSAGADPGSPYERKLDALMSDPTRAGALQPRPPQTLTFAESKPGHYALKFTDTKVPGVYRFRIGMDTNVAGVGHIVRSEEVEAVVKVRPDPAKTEVVVAKGTAPGVYTLTLTPKDQFDNFLGPGYASSLNVVVTGAKLGSVEDVANDGTYVVTVTDVASEAATKVVIAYDGTEVKTGTLDDMSGGGGGGKVICRCNLADRGSLGLGGALFACAVSAGLLLRRRRREAGSGRRN